MKYTLLVAIAVLVLLLAVRPGGQPDGGTSGPGVGQVAPGMDLADLQGHRHTLAALRGHPVALIYLATWCQGCRDELPALVHSAEALRRRGLVLLGVDAVGESAEAVARFARSYRLPFPVLLDPSSATMATFAVAALPTTVVIDRSGRIVLHLEAAADEAALARAAFGHTESHTTK